MTTTTEKKKTEAAKTETALKNRIGDAGRVASEFGGALNAGGRAYAGGLLELGRTLGGFGREILNETNEHVRATFKAKCLREVAELQAAFVQHRVEMSATHSKEFIDLARAKTEEVIVPFTERLKNDKTA
jgi:hypothetical protein